MTTLISWISFDQRKFAAAYVASDSRITWDVDGKKRWDAGRKVFPSKGFPDVFAYAGDVLFPALALSQIVEATDAGVMFPSDATPWQRHATIFNALQDSFRRRHQAVDCDFSILHLARSDQEVECIRLVSKKCRIPCGDEANVFLAASLFQPKLTLCRRLPRRTLYSRICLGISKT